MKRYRKKSGKKALALFLVLVMCLSMLNLTALAADSDNESANDGQSVIDTQAADNGANLLSAESAAQSDNAAAVGGESAKTEAVQSDEQVNDGSSDSGNTKEAEEDATVYPVEYVENGTTYELHKDGTATITAGKKDENDRIVVPATVIYEGKEYKVTVIGENAFAKQGDVSEIVLPEGLEIISKQAFFGAYLYDNDLIIPDSVVTIGVNAFYGFHACATADRHIEKIVLGKNLKAIDDKAFYFGSTQGNGNGLSFKVKLECYPNIEKIASKAFAGSSSNSIVSEITIHDAYEGQLDTVLNKCTGLKNVSKVYELGLDVNHIYTLAALRQAIAEAEVGEPVILKLEKGFIPSGSSIVIPDGKDITITDNGNKVTIDGGSFKTGALFVIDEGGKLTLDSTNGENLVINGPQMPNTNRTGNASVCQVNGNLVMKGGIIKCGAMGLLDTPEPFCAAISLRGKNAKFLMEGGTITNALISGPHVAPVTVGSGAEFEMIGGTITKNSNESSTTIGYAAGAVLVYGWGDGDVGGKMTLSGDAVISENTNSGVGGAVTLVGNAELYMNGGVITGNQSIGGTSSNGGGVCVAGKTKGMDNEPLCKFIMDGGVISNNTAEYGGGIYVNSNDVTLNAGEISGNKAYATGGGVYVETPKTNSTAAQINNALITQNTASAMGGGMYFCPYGLGKLYVNEGAAIFDNTASRTLYASAADDFVALGDLEHPAKSILASRMLGGGLIEWYVDGSVNATGIWGTPTDDLPRYDAENPQRVLAKDYDNNIALKSLVDENAKQLAEASATLIIKENSATRGGGVGANGSITVGSDEKFNVNVNKVWDSSVPAGEWKPITVQLLMNVDGKEYELEKAELSAANNWSAVFADLPASAKGHVSVKELDSEYVVSYERQNDGNDVSFTITNSKLTSLTVNKVWVNDDESTRPAEIMVQLYDNNEASGEVVQLNADNGWSHTWNNLPVNGHEWTVGEVTVPDRYTSSQTVEGNVVTITNTYNPPKKPGTSYGSLTVNKVWVNDNEDNRPDSIDVQLYRDGSAYGRAVTLSADNDWSYTWSRLSKSSDWTVGEVDVPAGYTSATSESGSTVTITNTYSDTEIDEPDVPLTDNPLDPNNPSDPDDPKNSGEVDLNDPDVPLSDGPDISTDVELDDPAVPLANSPKTGDDSFPWLWVVVASGVGLTLLIAGGQKRRRKAD